MMTGLGALQGIYLGMLGFAKFVPETAELWMKALFLMPLLCCHGFAEWWGCTNA
ncbi:MAG: hypothetical protein ABI977_33510 [Acidobacteriota bacterium]